MGDRFDIVQVADISVGYGNYDSLSLISSLQRQYNMSALILEPDQWDKPLHTDTAGIAIRRLPTTSHFRSATGRVEFIIKAAEEINKIRPAILIIRCSWNIPVLLKLKRKPKLVVYHATESTLYYGDADPAYNRLAAPWIDLIVFPEENRAMRDVERCGFKQIPIAIAYNCPIPRDTAAAMESAPRNGRVLYSGALDRKATYIDYYAHESMRPLPIDIYGYIGGSDAAGTKHVLESLSGNIRYKGYVDTKELESARPHYAYSLTIWNPSNENQHFACPCKFFESIGSLVPPITAPHPQCKMLVERYQCGIVMDDWRLTSFQSAISRAVKLYGTSAYDNMVQRCKSALLAELNWDHQFEKIKPMLPASI